MSQSVLQKQLMQLRGNYHTRLKIFLLFLKIFQLPSQYFHAFKVGRPVVIHNIHIQTCSVWGNRILGWKISRCDKPLIQRLLCCEWDNPEQDRVRESDVLVFLDQDRHECPGSLICPVVLFGQLKLNDCDEGRNKTVAY